LRKVCPSIIQPLDESLIVARQSSITETTQPSLSNETCVKLREDGFDETNILVDARTKCLLSQMLIEMVRHPLG